VEGVRMEWTGSKIFGFESLDEVINGFSFKWHATVGCGIITVPGLLKLPPPPQNIGGRWR